MNVDYWMASSISFSEKFATLKKTNFNDLTVAAFCNHLIQLT